MNRFFLSHPPPPVKKIWKCTHVVSLWNNPIGLLDIAHKYKAWHLCYLSQWGLCVISSVSNYILLEMALLSEHLQTDGFESFWYRNFEFLMIAFTMGLSGFVQTNRGSYTLCRHELNSLKFLTKFHHCYQNKACIYCTSCSVKFQMWCTTTKQGTSDILRKMSFWCHCKEHTFSF